MENISYWGCNIDLKYSREGADSIFERGRMKWRKVPPTTAPHCNFYIPYNIKTELLKKGRRYNYIEKGGEILLLLHAVIRCGQVLWLSFEFFQSHLLVNTLSDIWSRPTWRGFTTFCCWGDQRWTSNDPSCALGSHWCLEAYLILI